MQKVSTFHITRDITKILRENKAILIHPSLKIFLILCVNIQRSFKKLQDSSEGVDVFCPTMFKVAFRSPKTSPQQI